VCCMRKGEVVRMEGCDGMYVEGDGDGEVCVLSRRKGEVVNMEGWDGMIEEGGGCQKVFRVEGAVSEAEMSNER
jgi:hypothetical protein